MRAAYSITSERDLRAESCISVLHTSVRAVYAWSWLPSEHGLAVRMSLPRWHVLRGYLSVTCCVCGRHVQETHPSSPGNDTMVLLEIRAEAMNYQHI